MLRKTISIDEHLYIELEKEGVLDSFKNFSELVSTSLKQTIEAMKKENYKKQIAEMANDPMVLSDIEEVEDDFQYADGELNAF
jgi:DNA-binding transcriptional regulator YhcF (GntR family)